MKLSSIALTFGLAAISSISCAQSATYMIEPTHTYVTWEAKHFGTSTSRGRFDKKAGSITLDKTAKTGSVDVAIQTDSINTGFSVFDKHLQSEEFFASEKFPQARFVGNAFKFDGDKVTEVAGTLTLRGKTNPVVLKATGFNCYSHPMLKREVCGGDFETTIVRSQYDVSYGLPGIPDNIRLLIQVEAVKQ
jgi:polyisoprenoid-binding protein YceI